MRASLTVVLAVLALAGCSQTTGGEASDRLPEAMELSAHGGTACPDALVDSVDEHGIGVDRAADDDGLVSGTLAVEGGRSTWAALRDIARMSDDR